MNTKRDAVVELISSERMAREMSHRKFARAIGINFQRVHQWERGERSVTDTALLHLMEHSEEWISNLGFKCFIKRYPVIVKILQHRKVSGTEKP